MTLEITALRGGYAWIFPKGDHLNLGVGGDAVEGPHLRDHLRRLCEAYDIDPAAATGTRGYRLPMRRATNVLARGTTAVIGDAGGLVDPFSGDGMYEAFLSARLVSAATIDVLRGAAETLEPYANAVEKRITPLAAAGWGAKAAFDRFPRTTFLLARIPATFRGLEKILQGELPYPSAARGLEKRALQLVFRVAKLAT
jgi:flavin-dependent dehydrogenase